METRKRHPILVIIPHGGYRIPAELADMAAVSDFDLFFQADTSANEIFSFENVAARIDTDISRLCLDTDRRYDEISSPNRDGVIKKLTLYGKNVFREGAYPDEIAISNILKRYYFPFHETIEKIIGTGEIKLIIDCHTIMAVAPSASRESGRPRPMITLYNRAEVKNEAVTTCPDGACAELLSLLEKNFYGEEWSAVEKFIVSESPSTGYVHRRYGASGIPMIRISLSKSLFLNEKYFDHSNLRIDASRIADLKKKLWRAVERLAGSL